MWTNFNNATCVWKHGNYEKTSQQWKWIRTVSHMLHINNETLKSTVKLLLRMSVAFYSSFVCISAYANVYLKTILRECLRAGLPSGFPSTAPPPVLVPAVLGTIAVGFQTKKTSKYGCVFCCISLRPRMEKSHFKRHEQVDCPLFSIAK